MALVVRFILPGAVSAREDVFVAGAGLFARGVLDIPAGDANALSAVRAAVGAMATEVGTVDNSVTPPPVQGTGNPYPQYLTLAGAAASVQGGTDQFSLSLKAAYDAAGAAAAAQTAAQNYAAGVALVFNLIGL